MANPIASFVEALLPQAKAAEAETGIPAHILLGQAGLETGWGRSLPKNADGTSSNNYFGIKAGGNWQGKSARTATNEEVGGRMVRIQDNFRAYDSPSQSMADWAKLLSDNRYANAKAAAMKGDPSEFGNQIYKAGYATDSRYPQKVSAAISAVQREMGGNEAQDLSSQLYGAKPAQEAQDLSAQLYGKQTKAPAAQTRPGAFMRGVEGIAQGIADPINALGQLFTQTGAAVGLPGAANKAAEFNKYVTQQDAQYKRDVRGGQPDFDFGRMTGNVVSTLPLTMAAPVGASMASAAGFGAGAGLLSGALQPVTQGDFWDEKRKQVMAGAAGGAAFGAGGRALAGMISPTVNPQVALLQREGVTPTIGQIMGGGFRSAEEKLSSVPIFGAAINNGQRRANEQFNQAAWNRALEPLGEKLPKGMVGREAAQFVWDRKNQAYDNALNAVGPIAMDRQLVSAMNAVKAGSGLKPNVADELQGLIQANVFDRARNGYLTPEDLQGATAELRRKASGYISDPSFDNRELGQALQKAHEALQDAISRQAPPGASAQLQAAKKAYANYVRAERAAGSPAAVDGIFSPAQLQAAVRAQDPTRSGFARGTALMQDLSDAGKSVLAQKVPDSGTPGRAMAAAIPAALATGSVTLSPWLALGLPPALAYTATGQRALSSLLTGRQGAGYGLLSDAARRLAVPGGVALSPALQGLLNQ
jgi:hypothetical protein